MSRKRVFKQLFARNNIVPDPKDNVGQTPLSMAASGGHETVVNLLLTKQNVDPNSQDNDGHTPLSLAV